MTQQCVLIFAKTPYHKTPYDRWLSETGIEPLLLVPEEYAASYRHLPHSYVFANYDQNPAVEKKALELARTQALVGIFARGEADILRAARVRERLQLPGQQMASAVAYRNKVRMKDWLRGTDVVVPDYCAIDSTDTIRQFIERAGYPVVIKPVAESGSWGVQIIRDAAALAQYLATAPIGAMEMETFVEGPMYHVDGLRIDSEIVFMQPSQYVNDCLSFRRNEFCGSCALASGNPLFAPLCDVTRAVIAALPSPPHMAFHAEIWQRPDGQLVFCEIASRTGGGMISAMLQHCCDFDIDRAWLRAECGLPHTLHPSPYRPGGAVIIPPQHGVLQHLPCDNEPACVRAVQFSGAVGQRFAGGVKSGLFLAGYVVDGTSESDVLHNMAQVATWFATQVRYGEPH